MQLHERIEKINSKEDLADFIESLRSDFEAHPDKWNNPSLSQYLAAMESWVRSMDHYYVNTKQEVPKTPSWRTLADILIRSKDI
ncbi:MAG TPA: hypothetical protein VF532_22850 [Candidatus Angelobacter sp.]